VMWTASLHQFLACCLVGHLTASHSITLPLTIQYKTFRMVALWWGIMLTLYHPHW
jgi:hypothetical protein